MIASLGRGEPLAHELSINTICYTYDGCFEYRIRVNLPCHASIRSSDVQQHPILFSQAAPFSPEDARKTPKVNAKQRTFTNAVKIRREKSRDTTKPRLAGNWKIF
jgi:hypothetical protein